MQAVGDPTEVSAPGKIANDKVEQLRKEMAVADGGKGVSAYIIPTEDPHMVRLSDLSACHYLRIPLFAPSSFIISIHAPDIGYSNAMTQVPVHTSMRSGQTYIH